MNRKIFIAGSLAAMLAIIFGAFGAHALKEVIDPYSLEIWNKGVLYQMVHALALLLCGLLADKLYIKYIRIAAYFFFGGIILFSGSLYLLAFGKILPELTMIGPATPVGGLCFILGWLFLILAAKKE